MKKIFAFVLISTMIFALSACGSDKNGQSSASSAPTVTYEDNRDSSSSSATSSQQMVKVNPDESSSASGSNVIVGDGTLTSSDGNPIPDPNKSKTPQDMINAEEKVSKNANIGEKQTVTAASQNGNKGTSYSGGTAPASGDAGDQWHVGSDGKTYDQNGDRVVMAGDGDYQPSEEDQRVAQILEQENGSMGDFEETD